MSAAVGIVTNSYRFYLVRVGCRPTRAPAKPPVRCPDRLQGALVRKVASHHTNLVGRNILALILY
jgi:hypothetical protein